MSQKIVNILIVPPPPQKKKKYNQTFSINNFKIMNQSKYALGFWNYN